MAKIEQIAQSFLGQAAANPQQRHEICRQAAYTFMGLAQDPKNARASQHLAEVGLQFARAAGDARPPVMDDFADLLKETQIAYDLVGPYGDDPMDLIAARREIHEDRTPRTPGQIFITPESFNRDATLGRSATITFNPTEDQKRNGIQQSQTVAFWQGVKKEAQAMTVDINLGFLPSAVDPDTVEPGSARPYAEVEFGSDGNRTKFLCDIALGKRLTVVGNYCSVLLGMAAPGFGDPSPVITGGASIGAFAAPSTAPLVYTLYVDGLASLDTTNFLSIPMKAAFLLPILSTVGGAGVLEFYDIGGNGIGNVPFSITAATPMVPIPIPGDASYVRVVNSTLFTANYRLPFQLAV